VVVVDSHYITYVMSYGLFVDHHVSRRSQGLHGHRMMGDHARRLFTCSCTPCGLVRLVAWDCCLARQQDLASGHQKWTPGIAVWARLLSQGLIQTGSACIITGLFGSCLPSAIWPWQLSQSVQFGDGWYCLANLGQGDNQTSPQWAHAFWINGNVLKSE
jgi:hypothetical protein